VSNVFKIMSVPVNISPGAIWRYATVTRYSSLLTTAATPPTPGDNITYKLTFKNFGGAAATNVEAAISDTPAASVDVCFTLRPRGDFNEDR
jgi:uncharacterized repeat protein (TIGR01451 family)